VRLSRPAAVSAKSNDVSIADASSAFVDRAVFAIGWLRRRERQRRVKCPFCQIVPWSARAFRRDHDEGGQVRQAYGSSAPTTPHSYSIRAYALRCWGGPLSPSAFRGSPVIPRGTYRDGPERPERSRKEFMRVVKIRKKSGAYRTIYCPGRRQKQALRALLPEIARKARMACPEEVCHGFTEGRSPVTNALAHVGRRFTTCFDLRDFFDTVRLEHVRDLLTAREARLTFVSGAPRQGLPTSPAVANLAAAWLDRTILKWVSDHALNVVYTRYADDLSFSYDDPELTAAILRVIPQIVIACGFQVNDRKTRTQSAKRGRRMITGVAVDQDDVHAPRDMKRRLRAAQHQNKSAQARGLGEWCKLPLPRPERARHVIAIKDELTDVTQILARARTALGQALRLLEDAAMASLDAVIDSLFGEVDWSAIHRLQRESGISFDGEGGFRAPDEPKPN
jgi:hypothetical protein